MGTSSVVVAFCRWFFRVQAATILLVPQLLPSICVLGAFEINRELQKCLIFLPII